MAAPQAALGSTAPHYMASKIFPCILARRPLLGVFHEGSTVCGIMEQAEVGELITFSAEKPAPTKWPAIESALHRLTKPSYTRTKPRMEAIERHSARAMSRAIFALLKGFPRVQGGTARAKEAESRMDATYA